MKQVSTTELNVRILKEGTCPSLSGRSLLSYHIGCTEDSAIHIRVHQNTGEGYFSREWISFSAIAEVLGTGTGLTADAFRATFQGKSVNTAGFLVAVLKDLGLVKTMTGNQRCYEFSGSEPFIADITALASSAVSLPDSTPEPQAGKRESKPKKSSRSPVES